MSDQDKSEFYDEGDTSGTSPARRADRTARKPASRLLAPWKVILHNDDVNVLDNVLEAVYQLTPLNRAEAFSRTREAHANGTCLLLVTHRERAELYVEQFEGRQLKVTIEPAK